jgi:diguanylate cyclase (GGDEF)-like protein
MGPNGLAGLAYVVAAALLVWDAVSAWRHDAHNPTFAAPSMLVLAGGSWWAITDAAALSTNGTVAAIGRLAVFPGPGVMVAAFVCVGLCLTRPQWVPGRWLVVALLVEPVLITFAGLTNPWHLLVYGGPGAAQLVGSAGWTYGPLYWADTGYCFLGAAFGVGIVARAWWSASSVVRAARLALILAAMVAVGAYGVYRAGGFGQILDPMPLTIAVLATIMNFWVHRQDAFAFSPIARALIVDQIGDAVAVISPGGKVLDLNLAAVTLVRAMNPDAPDRLVGAPARELFGDGLTIPDGREAELVVELLGGRVEVQVRASVLVDRRDRTLGTVYVARDVTEANAVSRRLAAAHSQLVQQVETIEKLRVDLVELTSRDPLTGLHNRRHLVECFASMIATAQDAAEPLTAVLFDVDRFKAINDDYGHLAGDAVLVELAQRIRENAPPDALVARWGGEEYFVALPGADAATGFAFADDLRYRCEQEPVVVAGRMIHCTLSGGVSTYPASGTTMDELFHSADESMYAAKNAGRNRVRLHGA